MFRPNWELQLCIGISMVLLSTGGAWSMVSGAWVEFRAAGIIFSVNRKLERVDIAEDYVKDSVTELKQEPKVDRQKIRAAEQQLQLAEPIIEDAKTEIQHDLEKLSNKGGY